MTAQQVFDFAVKSLSPLYENREAENIAHWLVEEKLGFSKAGMRIHGTETISEVKANELAIQLMRLMKGEPIQYVLGYTEFYGLRFKVNRSVLIPRPETEELVDWIVKEYSNKTPLNILDIGTGSGCIAIALKKNLPEAACFASDISEGALEVARENSQLNNVEVHFFRQDILTQNHQIIPEYLLRDSTCLQVIVSNPPYIPYSESASMHKNVLEFEPHIALFVQEDDPLQFYRATAEFAQTKRLQQASLFFEMNEQEASSLASLMKMYGYQQIDIRKDLNGKDRLMRIRR